MSVPRRESRISKARCVYNHLLLLSLCPIYRSDPSQLTKSVKPVLRFSVIITATQLQHVRDDCVCAIPKSDISRQRRLVGFHRLMEFLSICTGGYSHSSPRCCDIGIYYERDGVCCAFVQFDVCGYCVEFFARNVFLGLLARSVRPVFPGGRHVLPPLLCLYTSEFIRNGVVILARAFNVLVTTT